MFKQRLSAVIAFLAISASTFADRISWVGLAESKEAFVIERNDEVMSAASGTLTQIREGDLLRTDLERLVVRMPEDNLLVLNGKTTAVMETADRVRLDTGAVVAGFGGSVPMSVACEELLIAPLPRREAGVVPSAGEGPGSAVLVDHSADEAVKIAVANGMAAVKDAAGRQLAVIAPGEVVTFVRNAAGQWLLDPTRRFLSQIGTSIPPPQAVQEVTDDQLIGGFWLWFGGAAAVGGTTAAVLILDDDDDGGDDDDDDDRPPVSPR